MSKIMHFLLKVNFGIKNVHYQSTQIVPVFVYHTCIQRYLKYENDFLKLPSYKYAQKLGSEGVSGISKVVFDGLK